MPPLLFVVPREWSPKAESTGEVGPLGNLLRPSEVMLAECARELPLTLPEPLWREGWEEPMEEAGAEPVERVMPGSRWERIEYREACSEVMPGAWM